jgi:hypothetical protein
MESTSLFQTIERWPKLVSKDFSTNSVGAPQSKNTNTGNGRKCRKNVDEGYARRLSAEERNEQSKYYLPHFGEPKGQDRPELRLVYDAAVLW